MFAADVKVYQTTVLIDEDLSAYSLKPQMSAKVTITATAADKVKEVLTIPIQAAVGNMDMAENRICYVIING